MRRHHSTSSGSKTRSDLTVAALSAAGGASTATQLLNCFGSRFSNRQAHSNLESALDGYGRVFSRPRNSRRCGEAGIAHAAKVRSKAFKSLRLNGSRARRWTRPQSPFEGEGGV